VKILLNLATLKKGGGQNVGLNYIKCLISKKYNLSKFYFVVAEHSSIELELLKSGLTNFISVSNNPIKRMFFELTSGGEIIKQHKIDVVYTLFGIGLYPKSCMQISGSADSNIFFPEIDFWKGYTGLGRLKKRIVDKYRIYALKRADAVVFENEAMLKRSKKLFKLKNSLFSKPSINNDFPYDKLDLPKLDDSLVGLFLCGWQKNKKYILIPELLHEFKRRNVNFHILFTASELVDKPYKEFMRKVNEFKVEDRITLLDSVKKTELKSLYESVDYVFLLSKLESFSNNIIESWFFKKTLITADEEWSRAICKESAVYVDRNSVTDIFKKIIDLENSVNRKKTLIEKSNKILKTYPTISEKINLELNYIKSIYEKAN
jgi:glycosyltransferase involved in cell wall biosynthesis